MTVSNSRAELGQVPSAPAEGLESEESTSINRRLLPSEQDQLKMEETFRLLEVQNATLSTPMLPLESLPKYPTAAWTA